MLEFPLDETWVSYDNSRIIGGIDDGGVRSMGALPSQFLIHHEYNTDDSVNFIPLKGNISYGGNSLRGAYTEGENDFCFRMYNSIDSGFNQEKGRDTILLNFTFREQEFLVKPGETHRIDTAFMEEGVVIPLAETMFVKNGAFGSESPEMSDRVTRTTVNTNGRLGGVKVPRNSSYLCSWLCKTGPDAVPVWLDRYYFPEAISESDARFGKVQNYIALNHAGDGALLRNLQDRGYFDIESDLVFERDNIYEYRRVSPDDIRGAVEKMQDFIINAVKNEDGKTVDLGGDISFNGKAYRKIDIPSGGDLEALTFNADVYIDPGKPIGVQVFGSVQNDGLVIRNRCDLAPFHYYATEDEMVMLNNRYERVHALSLKETCRDSILKFFCGEPFDNVLVVSPVALYILSYDLQLKGRLSLMGGESGDAVYGLGGATSADVLAALGISQRIYPYNNKTTIPLTGEKDFPPMGVVKRKRVGTGSLDIGRLSAVWKTATGVGNSGTGGSFSCTISSLFTETSAQLYHNNLYIPYKKCVVKLVFHPDSVEDRNRFTESIQKSYPAMAYILPGVGAPSPGPLPMGLESGAMEEYRSVSIDETGTVRVFPYDETVASGDGETVYGVFRDERYSMEGSGSAQRYVFAQRGGEAPSIEYASRGSFARLKAKRDGSLSFIHTTAEKSLVWKVYDSSKRQQFSMVVTGYSKVLSLDSYSYIDAENRERSVFTLLCTLYDSVYRLEWDTISQSLQRSIIQGVSGIPAEGFGETNNSEALNRNSSSNALYFELRCPAFNSFTRNILSIKWDISKISAGWYNINAMADLRKADFEVKVNDKTLGRVFYSGEDGLVYETDASGNTAYSPRNSFFMPYVNTGTDAFHHTHYLGTIGKEYGTTLNDLLQNDSLHDPYACTGCEMENAALLTKSLSFGEYQALRLLGHNINPVVLTLPCGERNGIEEMERFLKYSGGGSISNTVSINIAGSGIVSENGKAEVARRIRDEVAAEIDGTVEISNITLL